MLVCSGLASLAEGVAYAEENVVSERGTAEQHFVREVWPLLSEKCHACHGKDRQDIRGGLDLTTSAAAQKGGESGEAAIVPGQPERSPLFLSVTRSYADWGAMPPKDNDALTSSQVEVLRKWIRDGAAWIEGPALARHASPSVAEGGVQVRTSRALDPAWEARTYATEDLWAYRPLQMVAPPDATAKSHRCLSQLPDGGRISATRRESGYPFAHPPGDDGSDRIASHRRRGGTVRDG